MGQILDGRVVAKLIKDRVKDCISKLNFTPELKIFQVGDEYSSNIYIKNKEKAAKEIGVKSKVIKAKDYEDLLAAISKFGAKNFSKDTKSVAMIQAPFTESREEEQAIFDMLYGYEDADCLSSHMLGKIITGTNKLAPCTAEGVMDLLRYYGISVSGKNVVIVGRSTLVGKPTALLMLNHDATVTICHSHTENLKEFTFKADILVVAIGKPKYITADMVKEGAVVIDVGINRGKDGKLCGDVDFENVKEKASAITPVPGGVGAMTVAELMKNTFSLTTGTLLEDVN